jgi:YD repeat-containing protein
VATDQYLEGSTEPVYGTRTVYDGLGRAVRTVRLEGVQVSLASGETTLTSAGTELWSTATEYDSEGRVSRTIAANGQTGQNVYDSFGRQIATIGHPLPATEVGLTGHAAGTLVALRSETVYNALGQVYQQRTNIRQITLPDGTVQIDGSQVQTTTFEYDAFGNQTKTIFADGTFTRAAYDDLGRKVSETNQMALTRTFEYDDSGRLVAVELPGMLNPATGQIESPRYEYGYDAQGNQTLIRDPLAARRGSRSTRRTGRPRGRCRWASARTASSARPTTCPLSPRERAGVRVTSANGSSMMTGAGRCCTFPSRVL